jgi:molybdenum cofactor biosynthesis enzyme MoaA
VTHKCNLACSYCTQKEPKCTAKLRRAGESASYLGMCCRTVM